MAIIMNNKIKALLIPSLIPLIIVVTLGFINLDKKIKVKFLIWESQTISLGTSITISAISGFIIGSIPSLILQTSQIRTRRKVISQVQNNQAADSESTLNNDYQEVSLQDDNPSTIYFERDVRDPTPTIAVPFKVLKKSQQYIHNNNLNDQNQTTSRSINSYQNEEYYSERVSETPENLDWLDTPDENW